MQINTDGLVIMERTVGESDRLVTLLTREEGIIRAFSPLAKTLKSKQGSATQLLCYSRFSIYRGRDKYIINDAQPLEVFLKHYPSPSIFVSWYLYLLRKKRRPGIFCVWF